MDSNQADLMFVQSVRACVHIHTGEDACDAQSHSTDEEPKSASRHQKLR